MLKAGRFWIRPLGNQSVKKNSKPSFLIAGGNPGKLSTFLNEQGHFAFSPKPEAISKHTGVEPKIPCTIVETDREEDLVSHVTDFSQK
ncbi:MULTISPECIES: hypothetical protein [unclassified Legionella]|uniref:hypothetical protein n=1 Tax=unclassified Legionella TaxID=2622702 RepID=UPI0010566DF6|nr:MULTISPECIES: hypothetical protein [unclassified Legionella]MDI9819432.1 hypothetical protein [Legionella sp. PL877]